MSTEAQPQPDGHKDLKVVLSIRGDKASIGVQRPLCDPFIETFQAAGFSEELVQEIPGVIARAVARWQETPQFPKYDRPAPPPTPAQPRAARRRQPAQTVPAPAPEPEERAIRPRLF